MRQKELSLKAGPRRLNLSLAPRVWNAVGVIAERIGCSRSAVACCLLEADLNALSSLPKREVEREISACRRVLGDAERWRQRVVRRARGPSIAYIGTVLAGLLERVKG